MNSATVQLEAAQMGLIQRTQKYEDVAALKLVEAAASGAQATQAAAVPPVEPVRAVPREGSTVHVVA
jgi:hypothetical protein